MRRICLRRVQLKARYLVRSLGERCINHPTDIVEPLHIRTHRIRDNIASDLRRILPPRAVLHLGRDIVVHRRHVLARNSERAQRIENRALALGVVRASRRSRRRATLYADENRRAVRRDPRLADRCRRNVRRRRSRRVLRGHLSRRQRHHSATDRERA